MCVHPIGWTWAHMRYIYTTHDAELLPCAAADPPLSLPQCSPPFESSLPELGMCDGTAGSCRPDLQETGKQRIAPLHTANAAVAAGRSRQLMGRTRKTGPSRLFRSFPSSFFIPIPTAGLKPVQGRGNLILESGEPETEWSRPGSGSGVTRVPTRTAALGSPTPSFRRSPSQAPVPKKLPTSFSARKAR